MKKQQLILFIILCVSILGIVPNLLENTRITRIFLAQWSLIILIALFFLNNVWLKAFLVWCVIRHAIGLNVFEGHETFTPETVVNYSKYSYQTLILVFTYLAYYQVLINKFNTKIILNVICSLALVQSLFVILQYFGIWIFHIPVNIKSYQQPFEIIWSWGNIRYLKVLNPIYSGLLDNVNVSGAMLAISMPSFFRRKWVMILPIILLCLWLSNTIGAIIPACIVCWIWLVWYLRRWNAVWFSFLVVSAIAAIYLAFQLYPLLLHSRSLALRLDIWKLAWSKLVWRHWIAGWGLGQWKYAFPYVQMENLSWSAANGISLTAHNEYLQLLFEFGFFGVVFISGYVGSIIIKGLRNKSLISTICLTGIFITLINSGINFLFHTTVCMIPICYFAIIEQERARKWARK